MLDIKQFSSDLIDSSLDILTLDEKLLVFKEIKIIFTRYDFDLLFPNGIRPLDCDGPPIRNQTDAILHYVTSGYNRNN
jgi:hypothetical protein